MVSPPLAGQVGIMYMDEHVVRNEVVIRSLEQRQQSSLWSWGMLSVSSISQVSTSDGVLGEREKMAPECVKFVGDVGSWSQKEIDKWFPEEGDVRDFLRALDNFCPIPWLKEEAETEADNEKKNTASVYRVRVPRGGPGGYVRRNAAVAVSNSPKYKVIIYQGVYNGKLHNLGEVRFHWLYKTK